ncbi:ACP S-malonyltransferase [Desulfosarcina sp. OttesenSCG-928-G10]|nr:ACP S-malonyltransferase [Desulfosarcina sp. OttesenSCG-928-G10]MDL2321265.1 ACP S-malonyltransferase [Desulfosarcina sp. OttesenSCG-928-B08]
MIKIAFLFPGQGSQVVGMGMDLFQADDVVREIFDAADEIAGAPISRYCFSGPMETLTETVTLQPAITAMNLSCLAVLQRAGVACEVSAGHSLGEFSALYGAGVLSLADTLKAVFRRGELMHRESSRFKGAMSAIIGLDMEAVSDLVKIGQKSGAVSVANHNSATQIVITGSPEGVAAVSMAAKAKGAKAMALKVSGAWHSELIRGAEADFAGFLAEIPFASPVHPVIHNVTADHCEDGNEIRDLMVRQLCSPVRWHDTICRMVADKVTVFVEVGPGKVLTGLLKKIIPADYAYQAYAVNSMESLDAMATALS